MRKLTFILLGLLFTVAFADEGMFMPQMLKQNYKDMKAKGLEIPYKQIYNTKKPSIKDAIVSLGGFCTAEIISGEGLILTNHHCGYDAIRSQSTPENDYLTDGFWAMDRTKELPIEGLTVNIVSDIIDVTKDILAQVNDNMDADERELRIQRASKVLMEQYVDGSSRVAEVKEFYQGSEYYLYIYDVYEDIRLVGAPPSSIGKYGGDTDNWMWTRHTGDFSMFRIYAGTDNQPAAFSMDNQPYHPKHHLPVSIAGVKENDFAMILGFPGSTDRFLSSYGVKMAVETDQPTRVKIRGEKLKLMKEEMDKSDAVRLMYASTYAQVANYWKYFIGQSEQLTKNKVYDKKREIENEFSNWVSENEERKARYGTVLSDMAEAYKILTDINATTVYFAEAFYYVKFNRFLTAHAKLKSLLEADEIDENAVKAEADMLRLRYADFYEEFHLPTESKVLAAMLSMYSADVPSDQQPEIFSLLMEESSADIAGWTERQMAASLFSSAEKWNEFLDNPTKAQIQNERLLEVAIDILKNYRKVAYSTEAAGAKNKLKKANRLFIEALRKMHPNKIYAPDANFSLRLSYGNVLPYTNNEGKEYKYYTTIEGLMAKEDPNNPEFIVPAKLKELYEKKDYGNYGQDGTLWVNFLSNNDITGGNSGSPVINGKGELIGCAFDGNWEAMSGDIAFEDKLQRTISVDIRYVLFIIDKYAGAGHLIEEMTIVS